MSFKRVEIMKKSLMIAGLGVLMAAIAACKPSAPNASETVPVPAPPPETPAAESVAERAAYSEVPLPTGVSLVGADPEQIALDAFGITDTGEGNFREEVLVDKTADQALVTLTQTGLLDDSVEGMRYRLEFVPEGDQWRMDWAGIQSRCQLNRGSQDWTTELCT